MAKESTGGIKTLSNIVNKKTNNERAAASERIFIALGKDSELFFLSNAYKLHDKTHKINEHIRHESL
jgi:hypothetical protein